MAPRREQSILDVAFRHSLSQSMPLFSPLSSWPALGVCLTLAAGCAHGFLDRHGKLVPIDMCWLHPDGLQLIKDHSSPDFDLQWCVHPVNNKWAGQDVCLELPDN